ncbi:hypothetical protein ACFQZT_12710 [Paenibacillus sp. GCM10027628]|uniref:hypothetical protein n=1 Tax=Paenibacillus sp. GCM10027628 TaxID=3273413 RepID=UPI00362C35A1
MAIKEAMFKNGNYEIIYNLEQLKATNLKTGEVYGEAYFLSITSNEAPKHDFNLLLNTWSLLEGVTRKHMTNEQKERLKRLESHLSHLVDVCMGRA